MVGEEEEGVCWGCDEKEKNGLRRADEEDVEEEEEESVVDSSSHYRPAVVFGAWGVATFSPVVEG